MLDRDIREAQIMAANTIIREALLAARYRNNADQTAEADPISSWMWEDLAGDALKSAISWELDYFGVIGLTNRVYHGHRIA